jgi:hypothetical protein
MLRKTLRLNANISKRASLSIAEVIVGRLQPLVEAAIHGRGEVCASLSLAWTSYLGALAASSPSNNQLLVDLAVQVKEWIGINMTA